LNWIVRVLTFGLGGNSNVILDQCFQCPYVFKGVIYMLFSSMVYGVAIHIVCCFQLVTFACIFVWVERQPWSMKDNVY